MSGTSIPIYVRPGGGGGGGVTVHNNLSGRDAASAHPGTAISISVVGISAAEVSGALAELLSQITLNSSTISQVAQDFVDADQLHADEPVHADAVVRVIYDDDSSAWVLAKTGKPHTDVSNPKEFMWKDGAPDPTSELAEGDTVIASETNSGS